LRRSTTVRVRLLYSPLTVLTPRNSSYLTADTALELGSIFGVGFPTGSTLNLLFVRLYGRLVATCPKFYFTLARTRLERVAPVLHWWHSSGTFLFGTGIRPAWFSTDRVLALPTSSGSENPKHCSSIAGSGFHGYQKDCMPFMPFHQRQYGVL
jgi:hypothetical protein